MQIQDGLASDSHSRFLQPFSQIWIVCLAQQTDCPLSCGKLRSERAYLHCSQHSLDVRNSAKPNVIGHCLV